MFTEFTNPSIAQIKVILEQTKVIAVVGLSPKSKRPSFKVSQSMQDFGYQIIPVRPAVEEVLGEKAYADLALIPTKQCEKIDMVNVFRAGEKIAPIIDRCIELKLPLIWLQDGVINEAEAKRAQAAGITVVMDRCVYRDYLALCT
ncbi:MAG: CoA-binding protein [Woeseiaceae bacterium]